jgi:hypothetical protein
MPCLSTPIRGSCPRQKWGLSRQWQKEVEILELAFSRRYITNGFKPFGLRVGNFNRAFARATDPALHGQEMGAKPRIATTHELWIIPPMVLP